MATNLKRVVLKQSIPQLVGDDIQMGRHPTCKTLRAHEDQRAIVFELTDGTVGFTPYENVLAAFVEPVKPVVKSKVTE